MGSPPTDARSTDPRLVPRAAEFTYHGRPPSPAVARLRIRNHRERLVRGALGLAGCWGLAVVAVFLPMLHFVLVPGLLIAGVALGWHRLHEHATVAGASGRCPACGAEVDTTLDESLGDAIALRCERCRREIHLRVNDEPAAALAPQAQG
ncbi:MAG TPA: hypothetical protein VFK69_02365 [Candidatus Eisenbacteria bacterium]|nr:hypothetical protein [Candidatus Eisenbacteria bacterium]